MHSFNNRPKNTKFTNKETIQPSETTDSGDKEFKISRARKRN